MPTKYYLGYQATHELVYCADRVLANRHGGAKDHYVPMMNELVCRFVPETLDAMLLDTADAVGLSPGSQKIVHGAADTIAKASTLLVTKLIANRKNQELEPLVTYVDDTYLRAADCSRGVNSVACEVDRRHYEKIKLMISEVREGNHDQIRPSLHEIMTQTVDVILEGFMIRMIEAIKVNFFMRKMCDAAIVTSRGASHMVVNKVFKHLNEAQLNRLADHFDRLILTSKH